MQNIMRNNHCPCHTSALPKANDIVPPHTILTNVVQITGACHMTYLDVQG